MLVWFTPRMRVPTTPAGVQRRLARQYFHYGRWRREVVARHPETVRFPGAARYLAPPAAALGVVGGVALGAAGFLGAPRGLRWALLAPVGYLALVAAASVANGRDLPGEVRVHLPLVYATMHAAWGWGFLTSPPGLRSD